MPVDDAYFRRDQPKITAPKLDAKCTYAEHIVRARGKRTALTSVSLDPDAIRDFGDVLYQVKRLKLRSDGHQLVEHGSVLAELRRVIKSETKADRLRAIQALRYATRRQEGLIDWRFEHSKVDQKALLAWAQTRVSAYFAKKS
jgi:hypothetical protein